MKILKKARTNIFFREPFVLVKDLFLGCAVSQEIQDKIDGQTGSPNNRLPHHDLRIQDDTFE